MITCFHSISSFLVTYIPPLSADFLPCLFSSLAIVLYFLFKSYLNDNQNVTKKILNALGAI